MRFTTFLANSWFAWYPVRLNDLWCGRYEWAWLERVERLKQDGKTIYRRLGVEASPAEVGEHLEEIAAGKMVVRPVVRG